MAFTYKDFKYNGVKPEEKEFSYDDFNYDAYKESDIVTEAKNALDAQLANKPGAYQSQWQNQLNDTIGKILNREKFSYDLNGDALYQQYKDKYTNQAKMAMADTMGQAAAMTGGYGNSYAQSVGQQMYAKEMQNLNDVVPELYQMAYDKYNQEGQDLYNQYSMLGAQEEQEYGRYRDTVSDWGAERDYLTGRYDSERDYDYSKYNNERNFAYGQYADDRNFAYGQYADDRNYNYNKYIDDLNYQYGKYSDDRNLAYTDHRNTIADAQWQADFNEAVRQYNETMAYNKEQASKVSTGGGGGNTSYNNGADNSGEFHKATYSRTDADGNNVFYINGKEQTFAPGVNPYTGTKNKDVKNGTFSNGYQPNNVNGQKLSKTGITDVINGVTQNVWKTPDGQKWFWDGTQNKYLKYMDDEKETKSSGSTKSNGVTKNTYATLN